MAIRSSNMYGILLLAALATAAALASRYKGEQKQWKLRQELRVLASHDRQLF